MPFLNGGKGKLIPKRGSAAPVVIPWYQPTGIGSDMLCAWQAAGAADYAASLVNLVNPGTNNLATATPPTWSASNGWTSYVAFNTMTPISALPLSYIWYGYLGTAENSYIWYGDFWKMTGAPNTNQFLYIGNNSGTGGRYSPQCILTNPIKLSIIYIKQADNSQFLYINGVEVNGGVPQAGSAPWTFAFQLATANAAGCFAAALAKCVLSQEQVTEMHEKLGALP